LSVDRLTIKKALMSNVATDVTWDAERLTLANISGGLLGGRLAGHAQVDFAATPRAQGHIELADGELSSTAAWVTVPWAKGRARVAADFSFTGTNGAEVLDSLKAQGEFSVKDGALRHFSTSGDLAFRTWTGKVTHAQRSLEIPESKIFTANGELQLTGKVKGDLSLELQIAGPNNAYAIGGTLQTPQLSPAASVLTTASNSADDQLTQKKRNASRH
jgi:uncharacterized protein involved in outer membrane biogenesis